MRIRFFCPAILFVTAFLFFSCKHEKESTNENVQTLENFEKNGQLAKGSGKPYQELFPHVRFITENNSINEKLMMEQMDFIKSSGLPTMNSLYDWTQKNSIGNAYVKYRQFVAKNGSNRYLNTFKQYECWLILTRLDVLSKTDDASLSFVKTAITDLIGTKYEGYGLLYYALDYLKTNSPGEYGNGNIKAYSTIILAQERSSRISTQRSNSDSVDFSNNEADRGKPFPQEIKDMLNAYYRDTNHDKNKYIPLIENLAK